MLVDVDESRFVADGLLFFVMPFVKGESLRDRLDREQQLPVSEAVRIATDLGEALNYAHRNGVIHRDIKPANVLIHEGRPLIADFGIALAVGSASETSIEAPAIPSLMIVFSTSASMPWAGSPA